MDAHFFGIMEVAPTKADDFVLHEPERYDCICVPDEVVVTLSEKMTDLPVFWCSLLRPGRGLAYTGITLIPPESMDIFIAALSDVHGTRALRNLLEDARQRQKFVIHFGI